MVRSFRQPTGRAMRSRKPGGISERGVAHGGRVPASATLRGGLTFGGEFLSEGRPRCTTGVCTADALDYLGARVRGRPSFTPWAFSTASAAFVRCPMSQRSSSANAVY